MSVIFLIFRFPHLYFLRLHSKKVNGSMRANLNTPCGFVPHNRKELSLHRETIVKVSDHNSEHINLY